MRPSARVLSTDALADFQAALAKYSAKGREALPGDFPDDPDGEPRPRERLAPHDLLGQAQLLPHLPDLVLEQVAQGLDQLEVHYLGEAAHVVMALDPGGGP